MNGDPFRKVHRGMPARALPGAAWNAFIETRAGARAHAHDAAPGDQRGIELQQTTIIRVRNESGEDVERGGVLGIKGVLIDPQDNEAGALESIAVKGDTLDAATAAPGRFVVTLEPIGEGRIGRAVIIGTVWARVKGAGEGVISASAVPEESMLVAGGDGALVLFIEDNEEDERWALVVLGASVGSDLRLCVLSEPEPIEEDEEPFPTRWRAKYREIEPFFQFIDGDIIPKFRIRQADKGGWSSIDNNKRTWVIFTWEQLEPCEQENAECDTSVPAASDLCDHQGFTPQTSFRKGYLKRLEPASVDFEDGCYDRPPIVLVHRVKTAGFVEGATCNPSDDPPEGQEQPPFIAMGLGPIRACAVCEQ